MSFASTQSFTFGSGLAVASRFLRDVAARFYFVYFGGEGLARGSWLAAPLVSTFLRPVDLRGSCVCHYCFLLLLASSAAACFFQRQVKFPTCVSSKK